MSQITVLNQTSELVRIAVYKKSVLRPTLATIAWQIVAPPPGGQTVVPTPEDLDVYAEYSLDPNQPDPTAPDVTLSHTNLVNFAGISARLILDSGAVLSQVFTDLLPNQVRLENHFRLSVLSHLQKAGQDLYAPQVLWPGGVLLEDIRSTLYLAVVSQFTYQGSPLVDEEISMTETPILEGGTAVVTGSMWKGYSITVQ